MNIIAPFLFFSLFIFSLTGCGDGEPENTRPKGNGAAEATGGQDDGSEPQPAPKPTTTPTTTPVQNPYHVERYNKELKPNAPAPDSTVTTTCTKEGQTDKVQVVNEYFKSQPPPPIAGSALMCDWLESGTMRRFATVERDYCTKKAQERIDELKKEGYTCT